MTSNVGTKDLKNVGSFGFSTKEESDKYAHMKDTVEEAMKKLFNPEFLNRIDDTIVFRSLNKDDILKIIDIELKDLVQNIKDQKMVVSLDDSAKNFLVDKGYDEKFGARPLRRAIQKYVEDPLAEEILRGSFKEGTKIIAKYIEGSDNLIFYDEAVEINKTDEEAKQPGQVEN